MARNWAVAALAGCGDGDLGEVDWVKEWELGAGGVGGEVGLEIRVISGAEAKTG
jgi:hypothetical protein